MTPVYTCLSTHGACDYAPGSYWDGTAIICGHCKSRIDPPMPTGHRWVRRKGFWNALLNRGDWVPKWPEWIGGVRGVHALPGCAGCGAGSKYSDQDYLGFMEDYGAAWNKYRCKTCGRVFGGSLEPGQIEAARIALKNPSLQSTAVGGK